MLCPCPCTPPASCTEKTTRDTHHPFGDRGVDFKGVKTVINYQPPPCVATYTHRVGRTGRAGHSGIAVTLLSAADQDIHAALDAHLVSTAAASAATITPASLGLQPLPRLTAASVEALRYRAEDVARGITKLAVKEARARDLRQQLLNSERLAEHFASNPSELQLLQHTAPLRAAQTQGHLKHIPGYLRDQDAPGRPGDKARHRGTLWAVCFFVGVFCCACFGGLCCPSPRKATNEVCLGNTCTQECCRVKSDKSWLPDATQSKGLCGHPRGERMQMTHPLRWRSELHKLPKRYDER